jgi:hypothetical protein
MSPIVFSTVWWPDEAWICSKRRNDEHTAFETSGGQFHSRRRSIVIPGLDPGIAPTDRARRDPRIKSGDDEDEKSRVYLDPYPDKKAKAVPRSRR